MVLHWLVTIGANLARNDVQWLLHIMIIVWLLMNSSMHVCLHGQLLIAFGDRSRVFEHCSFFVWLGGDAAAAAATAAIAADFVPLNAHTDNGHRHIALGKWSYLYMHMQCDQLVLLYIFMM